jgi:hypothetical protein
MSLHPSIIDDELLLDNVRTLVFLTKSKHVIKTITGNEINIHKRSRNATRVRVTNKEIIGKITLDPKSIEPLRRKHSLRYKIIKYLIKEPTNVEIVNKATANNGPLGCTLKRQKLLYNIISNTLYNLTTETNISSVQHLFETYRSGELNVCVDRKFYFGNPSESVSILIDTFGTGKVEVQVDGQPVEFTRIVRKVVVHMQIPEQPASVQKKTIHLAYSGKIFDIVVYLVSINIDRCLHNLLNVELNCINGVRKDHSESLLACTPQWNIDDGDSLCIYYDYFMEISKDWTPNNAEAMESLLDFIVQTNSFFLMLYRTNVPLNNYSFVFSLKMLIDLFHVYNKRFKCKNPIIHFPPDIFAPRY